MGLSEVLTFKDIIVVKINNFFFYSKDKPFPVVNALASHYQDLGTIQASSFEMVCGQQIGQVDFLRVLWFFPRSV